MCSQDKEEEERDNKIEAIFEVVMGWEFSKTN